ncbi:DUF7117 family protein [Halorubrum trueperi]|uniref:TFIIB-type zinc ribbon-containing protein n=1 Tax=Halorubrum trueperi TaxID=2004704 RepID=A0ABD5UT56_9EURY
MKVRGERECRECGARWSYYETGAIECPVCESVRSVGVDERTAHTDAHAPLDLSAHRARFGEARELPSREDFDGLKTDLRAYIRKRGFINGGELLSLDDTYLGARELLEAVDCYERLRDPTDLDREYLFDLLAGADVGDRPAAADVPESLREARGMAAVRSVDEYRSDLLAFLDELAESVKEHGEPGESAGVEGRDGSADEERTVSVGGDAAGARIRPAREILELIRDRTKRVEALNGDVSPEDADGLVGAANDVGMYVRTGSESDLQRARRRLPDEGT